MKTPKQTKKYKEDIKNFGEPERSIDVVKYLGSLILIFSATIWVVYEIAMFVVFMAKKVL